MEEMAETVEILFSKAQKYKSFDFRFQQHFKAQKGKDGAGKKKRELMEIQFI